MGITCLMAALFQGSPPPLPGFARLNSAGSPGHGEKATYELRIPFPATALGCFPGLAAFDLLEGAVARIWRRKPMLRGVLISYLRQLFVRACRAR